MSRKPSSSSDEETNIAGDAPSHSDGHTTIIPTPDVAPEPQASPRGRTPARSDLRAPRRRDQPSPPPARTPSSPASSYGSATPTVPPIGKWTVAGLRKALENADIPASRKMHKAELYDLYVSSQATPKTTHRPSKSRTARNSPVQSPPSGSRTRSGSLHQSTRRNKPSSSLGRPPQSARAGSLAEEAQPSTTTYAAAAQYAAGPSSPPTATRSVSLSLSVSEIQDAGSRGGQFPNASSSIFRTDIPVTHPLKPLLDTSLDTILQAVSPRTLQTYVTAWRCFKTFHVSYNLPFPDFSLLTITSFISYLNSIKSLQVGSIKGYLSGIQFFHKLIYGAPSPEINNSQTSLLIKGIQRSQPNRPDTRQPITSDILTQCIYTLRTGYLSLHIARTLDAMFILAFFGFLRCSELAITSKFDPKTHPTISDLSVIDNETISFLIKQSKTDQTKKGHLIYIFKLSSPIQPFQSVLAYLQWRTSQANCHLDPLFIDESNKPVTRFWFQKHLKSVLQHSGIPAKNFSSHSFRIGAATSAAQKGLSQQQIQALGRWSSDAFQSYIRTNRFHIKKAHQTLIE
ncbi:uncharacterized protein LOC113043958 [Carassius auratus]|uniref:Uncharacterized protein LOC113043958 n=1 Tax=Carassius auratus TaxID=7957 RepID=A0A6P6JHY9_CARAU|nr:uncharacterized protein LOC113043958 [Carassius auratus]